MKKKILVTGAKGQLGRCIENIARQYEGLEFSFKDSQKLNITDFEEVDAVFKKGDFDFCINCAAYTNVEQAEKTPRIAYGINAKAVEHLALSCKKYHVAPIHISTDYVFNGKKQAPYTIDDLPDPINEYGRSKLEGEKHIQSILKDYSIVRTSWLYSEFGKNFYKTILEKAKRGENLHITDQQTGCPTDANNLAKFIVQRISCGTFFNKIEHFTDAIPMTWYGFAERI